MPESFDSAQRRLGRVQDKPYVPLSGRAAGNGGGGYLPGTNGTAVPQNKTRSATTDNTPPKASAAPKGNTNQVFTGLAEALNTNQQNLVKNKKQSVADEYVIEFAPASLGDARVKRQGLTNKKNTPMQIDNSAKKLDSATNSTNVNARSIQVSAGMQIVQFIDEVMRSSTYITDQQLYIVDEVTQKIKPNPNPPRGQVAWYKINVEATQLGYDKIRNDQAYRMKFVITPYAINAAPSDWFGDSRYRGSHKSYQYWFTGQNSQILNFEQEYNNLYRLIISGANIPVQSTKTDFRDQPRRVYFPTSEQHAKGAEGYTNEGADNLAGFLYSPSDQARARLKIVGDPAWMQQGEISTGISAKNFNFQPFNADGTINYDSQEVVFDISWNRPQDYDFNTGLMDLNRSNYDPSGAYSNQPQENATYTAIRCKNIFTKGKFEQELEGRLLIEAEKNNSATSTARSVATNPGTVTGARQPDTANDNNEWVDVNGIMVLREDVTTDTEDLQNQDQAQLLNSPPAEPPSGNAGIEPVPDTVSVPSDASLAASPNEGVQEKLAKAAEYDQRAAAARASGDVYAAATLTRLATQSRENAAADAKYGAPPEPTPPQKTARET